MFLPPPEYSHLLALIDDTGIFEHARFGIPRREHGYTVDDASRALIVLLEAPADADVSAKRRVLLSFLLDSLTPDGLFRNRLGFDRRWGRAGAIGDAQGRGLWALAAAAASSWDEGAESARSALEGLPLLSTPHVRPMAFSAVAAHALWSCDRDDPLARALATPLAVAAKTWLPPWPEPRLTYSNGRLPAGALAAGLVLDDAGLVRRGLDMLEWLVETETIDGHFSFTPVGGRSLERKQRGFDQQPIEAAAMADACRLAWDADGDRRWARAVLGCGAWLMGDNDVGLALYDPGSGATFDGLMPTGVNQNRGAESTIAGIAVLQACQAVGAGSSPRVLQAR